MEVIIRPTDRDAAELTARVVAKELRMRPNLVLGLATGQTMEMLYAVLVRMHEEEALDFSLASSFNLDEYIGLPADHNNSYRYYMDHHLFSKVNIDRRNTHLPNGMAGDVDAECRHYEQMIKDYGGIDLQLLGIGQGGHIGFNEPLSAMQSRTRAKALSPQTLEQNAHLFENAAAMPRRAITMGVGTILDAERCILLATGERKAAIIARAVEGPVTSMISATALQLHRRCTVIVDEAAALELENKEYYHWLFDNEPEWDEFR
jgi:glucosamine-6-phosphate deaminase